MTRRPLSLAAVALAVVAMVAMTTGASAGSSRDRATGGGQILVGTSGGAGDTIAFTAQQLAAGDDVAAKGEVQYINRTGGTGKGGIREHGDVFCIVVAGNMAEIGYHPKGGDTDDDIDQLYVVDGGEPNQGNDVVFIDETPQSVCEFDDDDDDGEVALARGNAQVYDAP